MKLIHNVIIRFKRRRIPVNPNRSAIIVTGVNRGGTSAISVALNALQIPSGDRSCSPTYEDPDLATLFSRKDWDGLLKKIAAYSNKHPIFAWKWPNACRHLDTIDQLFTRKKYIFVFRDIYAISIRQQKALGTVIDASMQESLSKYSAMLKFIQGCKSPYLLISYEKLLKNPEMFAQDLLQFLELEPTDERVNSVVSVISPSPIEYERWAASLSSGLLGHIDSIRNGMIKGWAKHKHSEHSLMLKLCLNADEIAVYEANKVREDLIASGISSSAKHGFEVPFDQPIIPGDKITIVDCKTETVIATYQH
ncbi:sulfotransferase [Shewanella corallii]|uniref:Sulfotransferase n=1 Tax=Shewanella corallii TaxID=560080 RepID=A0ABT0N6U4_9GAMM|nr:sulfotransferase [Shewanella corallii]MCL2914166.1 sulfotransferase [Shewanella corallii]